MCKPSGQDIRTFNLINQKLFLHRVGEKIVLKCPKELVGAVLVVGSCL